MKRTLNIENSSFDAQFRYTYFFYKKPVYKKPRCNCPNFLRNDPAFFYCQTSDSPHFISRIEHILNFCVVLERNKEKHIGRDRMHR